MAQKVKGLFAGIAIFISLWHFSACSGTKSKKNDSIVEKKIDSLLTLMTLEEKIAMIHANSSFTTAGIKRLGIPELVLSDGPHGVRPEHGRDWELDNDINDSATYLPTGIALAATWNPDLGYEFGKVLGSEAKYRGKDLILGPGVNIMRSPLNGRNFEYLSEDPYLSSVMGVGYIKGVQEQGVAACVKHYVANNQEQFRNIVNVKMSERALQEIYLPAFKAAITEGKALSIMGAYNRFRDEYCSHNDYLVNQVLKKEWGFTGVLMSDWNAVHNTKEALLKGTDLEMGTDLGMLPNPDYNKFYLADSALAMVKSGEVYEKYVDDKVRRVLRLMFAVGKFDNQVSKGAFNTKEHQQVAKKVAEESIVLLKNDEILPLNMEKVKTIAVIGDNAVRKHSMGGGSSQVRAKYEVTFLEALKKAVGDKATINFAQGYSVDTLNALIPTNLKEAESIAKAADIVIVVGGWVHAWDESGVWEQNVYDAEATDKPNMTMPFAQDELINKMLAVNPNTIVVLYGGGPIDMTKWADKVKGILQAWYPGMEGGTAIANVLCGTVNPSGKLPVTFPKKLEDSPAHALGEFPGQNNEVNYKEDIFVGYRYFDTYNVDPQYSFGHGLSYTSFEYKDLKPTVDRRKATISFILTNSGQRSGAEVAQVYVHDVEASEKRPEKELKGFKKVFLAPGESKTVEIALDEAAFSFYSEEKQAWVLEPGQFKISIGSSSTDLRLSGEIEIN
jgi:beta-glucosidase